MKPRSDTLLSAPQAGDGDIRQEWDGDNQQWWDWYMSLAENDPALGDTPLEPPPAQVRAEPLDLDTLASELATPFALTPGCVESFRRDGYVKLRQVISPGGLQRVRDEMSALFERAVETHGTRFASLEMMWQGNAVLREFVFSRRLARIAAELLGVDAVRLYHDNGLSKEPGCGRTPWHHDDHHFPIASHDVCTVWVPLQRVPLSMGPLAFACGMQVAELVADVSFDKVGTRYDAEVARRLREHGVAVDESPFDVGEVSFHHNLSFHHAGPNRTRCRRMVLATTYFADGARVIDAPHMVNGDWRRFMPGIEPGEVVDSPLNPVLYRAGEEAAR